jgi:hypothetical protein
MKECIPNNFKRKAIPGDEQEGDLGSLNESRSERHDPTVLAVHHEHQSSEAKP